MVRSVSRRAGPTRRHGKPSFTERSVRHADLRAWLRPARKSAWMRGLGEWRRSLSGRIPTAPRTRPDIAFRISGRFHISPVYLDPSRAHCVYEGQCAVGSCDRCQDETTFRLAAARGVTSARHNLARHAEHAPSSNDAQRSGAPERRVQPQAVHQRPWQRGPAPFSNRPLRRYRTPVRSRRRFESRRAILKSTIVGTSRRTRESARQTRWYPICTLQPAPRSRPFSTQVWLRRSSEHP